MEPGKPNALKREPLATDDTDRHAGLERREMKDEDLDAEREDDASDFFEESDEYPGDRRRDPLRRP